MEEQERVDGGEDWWYWGALGGAYQEIKRVWHLTIELEFDYVVFKERLTPLCQFRSKTQVSKNLDQSVVVNIIEIPLDVKQQESCS